MSLTVEKVGFQGSVVAAKDSSLTSSKVQEKILNIHRRIGWGPVDDSLATRYLDRHVRGDKSISFHLAIENEEIIGYAITRPEGDENLKTRYLSFIATVKKSHGIGTALMNQVFSDMKKRGSNNLILETDDTAFKFYEKYAIAEKKDLLIIDETSYRNGDKKYRVQLK